MSDFPDITAFGKFLWVASSFLKNNIERDAKKVFFFFFCYLFISHSSRICYLFLGFCLFVCREAINWSDGLFFFFFFLILFWLDSKGQFVNCQGEGGPKVIILDLNVKKIQNVYTIMIFFFKSRGATAPPSPWTAPSLDETVTKELCQTNII